MEINLPKLDGYDYTGEYKEIEHRNDFVLFLGEVCCANNIIARGYEYRPHIILRKHTIVLTKSDLIKLIYEQPSWPYVKSYSEVLICIAKMKGFVGPLTCKNTIVIDDRQEVLKLDFDMNEILPKVYEKTIKSYGDVKKIIERMMLKI